ncbi:MAG: LysR family transcriptional regulator [Marinibacterium sp.]
MHRIIPPTFQQMRLFEAVARHGSITRAAQDVNLTQPSVSMQIKALEEKIGLQLMHRMGRSVQLTGAGTEVAEASQEILQRMTEMRVRLAAMRDDIAGPLSIAVVSTARYFLPQLMGQFKRFHSQVEPRLQILNREKVLERLNEDKDDLYVMGKADWGDTVQSQSFCDNLIVMVAPPSHPLVGQRNIALSRLASEPMIQREAGSGTRKAVERHFATAQVKLKTLMEFDDSEAVKQGVLSGLGIAYLSQHALRLELEAGELAILDVQGFPLKRPWYLVYRETKALTVSARAFVEYIHNVGSNPTNG